RPEALGRPSPRWLRLRRPSDRHAELLVRPKRGPALLALHRERRRERRAAGLAARAHLAAALRARGGKLGLPFVEVPLREAAAETDRDPVAEHLAALLAEPVRRLAHGLKRSRLPPIEFGVDGHRARSGA